jgi:hypothetical protein
LGDDGATLRRCFATHAERTSIGVLLLIIPWHSDAIAIFTSLFLRVREKSCFLVDDFSQASNALENLRLRARRFPSARKSTGISAISLRRCPQKNSDALCATAIAP